MSARERERANERRRSTACTRERERERERGAVEDAVSNDDQEPICIYILSADTHLTSQFLHLTCLAKYDPSPQMAQACVECLF